MNVEQIIYQVMMYLNCVFEIFLLYHFLEALFPLYEDRKWAVRFEAFACITAIFVINHFKVPILNLLCVPLIYLLFVWLVFHLKFKISTAYVVFYYVILAVSEFAFLNIYPILGVDVTRADLKRIVFLIIQDILRFMVIQIVKQMHEIPYREGSYKYTKSLFLLPVSAMILLNGLLVPVAYPYANILISAGSILLIICSINNFSVVEKLLYAQTVIKDNEMVGLKSELERLHIKSIADMKKQYAEYIHDMGNIIKTLERLSETEGNQKIRDLSAEAKELLMKCPSDRKRYIGDPIVDTIFNERVKAAKEKGVDIELDIQNIVDLSFMNDLDKIRIFGNLLDNALEAASACDDGYISLSLRQGNDALVIFRLENNFKHKNNKKGTTYLTIKEDETRHGFGLRNVKELSQKYNGVLKITEEENTFIVMLILSNIPKPEKS